MTPLAPAEAQVGGRVAWADAPVACRLAGVGKRFGAVWACRDVELEVRAGEVHALVGENGAGKSTLVKLLHGLHAPDEGRVELGGAARELRSSRDAEAAGVAMAPQELDLFPDLSVTENLFVGRARPRARWGGFDRARMRREARAVFARLNVPVDVDAPVGDLSGAAAKMVEIARALIREARVIVFDEPTAALTETESRRLMEIIRGLAASGVAVIYISHRLEEVFAIADRVTVMRDGRRVHTGPAAALDAGELVRLMIDRPVESLFQRARRPPGAAALTLKDFGRRGAFEDIDLELRRGEIVGLSGLIGAGRSELAQAIVGLARPDVGELRLNGAPATLRDPEAARRRGVVYVPEERRSQGLILDYPLRWNVGFGALARLSRGGLVDQAAERAEAAAWRDRFAIRAPGLEAPVAILSGGNQQKVLLAKALACAPEVILLDEPTRGVDVGAKAEIYRIIDGLAAEGKAILLISSELNELLAMADRILVMREGRLTGDYLGPDFDVQAIGAAAAGVAPSTGALH